MLLTRINHFFPSFELETKPLFHATQLATLHFENCVQNKRILGKLNQRHIYECQASMTKRFCNYQGKALSVLLQAAIFTHTLFSSDWILHSIINLVCRIKNLKFLLIRKWVKFSKSLTSNFNGYTKKQTNLHASLISRTILYSNFSFFTDLLWCFFRPNCYVGNSSQVLYPVFLSFNFDAN